MKAVNFVRRFLRNYLAASYTGISRFNGKDCTVLIYKNETAETGSLLKLFVTFKIRLNATYIRQDKLEAVMLE